MLSYLYKCVEIISLHDHVNVSFIVNDGKRTPSGVVIFSVSKEEAEAYQVGEEYLINILSKSEIPVVSEDQEEPKDDSDSEEPGNSDGDPDGDGVVPGPNDDTNPASNEGTSDKDDE